MKQIDKFTTISLEERNGVYSLLEGWVNQNEEFRPNFCKREFGKKGEKTEKNVPVFVKLGDRSKAIEVALWIYKELAGEEPPF